MKYATSRTSQPKGTAQVVPEVANLDAEDKIFTDFVMTLQKTDAGFGQTTKGTSKRSPEIFIPLSARDAAPYFWGWKKKFKLDEKREGKYDRLNVPFHLSGKIEYVNMMNWPVKHDFRLRCEALRSAGEVDDILHLEKVDDAEQYEYIAEIIPQKSKYYSDYLGLCDTKVRNSEKKYGYY